MELPYIITATLGTIIFKAIIIDITAMLIAHISREAIVPHAITSPHIAPVHMSGHDQTAIFVENEGKVNFRSQKFGF